MHQGSGLQRVSRPFLGHVTLRQRVQVIVHHGHQLIERAWIPSAPGLEQLRNPVSWRIHAHPPRGRRYLISEDYHICTASFQRRASKICSLALRFSPEFPAFIARRLLAGRQKASACRKRQSVEKTWTANEIRAPRNNRGSLAFARARR